MFGFGRKKAEDASAKPGRSRGNDANKERAQLNLFGVPGVGAEADVDVGDEDLEDELLALLGDDGPPKRSKPRAPPSRPNKQVSAPVDNIAMSNYDVDIDSGGDDDEDIYDADLEEELGELTGQVTSRSQEAAPSPLPVSSIASTGSMVQLLEDRLVMYQKAKAKSDSIGDSGKSRRFTRGIKTLEDLLKKAKVGKVFDETEIPPVVVLGETKPRVEENIPNVPTTIVSEDIVPVPLTPESLVHVSNPEPAEPIVNVESNQSDSTPVIVDPLVDSRLKEYKKLAVLLKRSGDSQGGLEYLKLAKTLEAAIKSGEPVDLSPFPSIPPLSQSKSAESNQEESVPPQVPEIKPETTESMTLPNEIFAGPDAPKTIMEALQQRLDKYKSEVDKASTENNSSKARRMGRIVKQYEEAISNYKKGKVIQYDELPTPPGFAPIPVPGGTGENSSANTETSTSSLQPSQPMPTGLSPKVPRTSEPSVPTDPSPTKGPSETPGPSGSISRGVGKPDIKLTLQEKQLKEILRRQQLFKEAAVNAKKLGDVNQARELLRTAKGFDQLIEASKTGLPVDMNSLPSAPEIKALEAEDFELVSGEDCIEATGDISEVFAKLEEDLKNQLKICMRAREQFKSIGDIASANRYEKMALESKRDLDTLRLAAKQGYSVPKYHYETRVFSITECNTDLTEDEIEINILQGVNYKVANPADVDTFVKVELPYPSAEEAQVNKTAVIRDTNNPSYDATFKMTINRSARNFQRFIHNKSLKLEVWSKGGLCTSCGRLIFCRSGFLRSSTLIGTAQAKLLGLETKCQVHDAFDILDGRKSVGKLEVKIKLREPVLMKQITQKKEKWLSIDKL